MNSQKAITFVKNAIHRPDEPRHFMRLKRPDNLVTATLNGQTLASSRNTIKMQEAGFDLYDPVYYFPKGDIDSSILEVANTSTHCPLKGDTEYYHVKISGQSYDNAAFCYAWPLEEVNELKDYIAFDQNRIQVIEHVASDG